MNMGSNHRTVKYVSRMSSRPNRSRRAAVFIYFLVIGVPMALLGFAVAVDVSMIVGVRRAVQLTAESASVAGSFQYKTDGSGVLDKDKASTAARDLCLKALESGALPSRSIRITGSVADWCKVYIPDSATSVQVSIDYDVKGTFVLENLDKYLGLDVYSKLTTIRTREAGSICNPRDFGNMGVCYRPSTEAGVIPGLDRIAEKDGQIVGDPAPLDTIGGGGFTPVPPDAYYPYHYAGHYPSHYPQHYAGHYTGHYAPDDSTFGENPGQGGNTPGGSGSTTTTTTPGQGGNCSFESATHGWPC